MAGELSTTILTGVLGSGVIGAVLVFIKDRRKDSSDYTVATYKTLAEMNDRLELQVEKLQVSHDEERTKRRAGEEALAEEQRKTAALEYALALEQRRVADLTARVSALEGSNNHVQEDGH